MNGSTISTLLFVAGALLEGWLAAVLLLAARALRVGGTSWLRWLSAGFLANALRSTVMALGYGNVALDAVPRAGTALLAHVAIGCITAGLIRYAALPAPLTRRLTLASTTFLAVMLLLTLAGAITRWQGYVVSAMFVLGWASLMLHLMRREPLSGHGAIVAALLAFPAASAALRAGVVPVDLLPLLEIVPLSSLGMTVLTTGLIRAHRRAQHEAAQAALALAAREQAEAQLRAINETLEHRVAMRTAELRETIEGLESFNRSVSHDLRGPLGGITGVSRMAREALGRGDLTAADRLLAAIARQSESSTDLVTSLLQLARSAEGAVERRPVNTAALVGELTDMLSAAPQVVAIQDGLPDLHADPALVRQVFANLLANAIKFTAQQPQALIRIDGEEREGEFRFHIADNGVGFSMDYVHKLFGVFQRLHRMEDFHGTGIGLANVRRIVERHGGRLWAEGQPGQGATFYFTLEEQPQTMAS